MASTEPIQEATGRDLLHVPMAWAMARRIGRRQRFSTARLPLLDHSLRIDSFAFFVAHDFQVDRLSDWVVKRSTFDNTYAKTIRPKTDHELPSETLESVQHNQMPQFTLRNIGRFEMSVDLGDRLPFLKVRGLGGQLGVELDEVRKEDGADLVGGSGQAGRREPAPVVRRGTVGAAFRLGSHLRA
jgi:hypothetical protein